MNIGLQKIKLKFDYDSNGILFSTQGDTGRKLEIQVLDEHSEIVDITNLKLEFYVGNSKEVIKVDGQIKNAEQGLFLVKTVNEQFKYPGINKAQFVISDSDGNKIGSKIYELHVEESIENGATLGRNTTIDFSKLDRTMELLEEYNLKSLRADLDESRTIDTELKDDIRKAKEITLKEDINSANTVIQNMSEIKEESERLNTSLIEENKKAINNINSASEINTNLKPLIDEAKSAEERLRQTDTNATSTSETLTRVNSEATELIRNLGDKSEDVNRINSSLTSIISNATTCNEHLNETLNTANETKSSLSSEDVKAKKSIETLKEMLKNADTSKQAITEIISSGDLSQYITDPKLQEILKAYVTKQDLGDINIESKLEPYALKSDINIITENKKLLEDLKNISNQTAHARGLLIKDNHAARLSCASDILTNWGKDWCHLWKNIYAIFGVYIGDTITTFEQLLNDKSLFTILMQNDAFARLMYYSPIAMSKIFSDKYQINKEYFLLNFLAQKICTDNKALTVFMSDTSRFYDFLDNYNSWPEKYQVPRIEFDNLINCNIYFGFLLIRNLFMLFNEGLGDSSIIEKFNKMLQINSFKVVFKPKGNIYYRYSYDYFDLLRNRNFLLLKEICRSEKYIKDLLVDIDISLWERLAKRNLGIFDIIKNSDNCTKFLESVIDNTAVREKMLFNIGFIYVFRNELNSIIGKGSTFLEKYYISYCLNRNVGFYLKNTFRGYMYIYQIENKSSFPFILLAANGENFRIQPKETITINKILENPTLRTSGDISTIDGEVNALCLEI